MSAEAKITARTGCMRKNVIKCHLAAWMEVCYDILVERNETGQTAAYAKQGMRPLPTGSGFFVPQYVRNDTQTQAGAIRQREIGMAERRRQHGGRRKGVEKEMTQEDKRQALALYFLKGMEAGEIAEQMRVPVSSVLGALGDETLMEPYRRGSEAAKLRAQICVNESADLAARLQAELLRQSDTAQGQRAAKDILDRAGVKTKEGVQSEITIRFAGDVPEIGMPARKGAKEKRMKKRAERKKEEGHDA